LVRETDARIGITLDGCLAQVLLDFPDVAREVDVDLLAVILRHFALSLNFSSSDFRIFSSSRFEAAKAACILVSPPKNPLLHS
jgi:hypothetical protein